jgi:hypothetical protein
LPHFIGVHAGLAGDLRRFTRLNRHYTSTTQRKPKMNQTISVTPRPAAIFNLPFAADAAKILLGACAAGVVASAILSLAVLVLIV